MYALIAVVFLAVASVPLALPAAASTSEPSTGLIVPLYIYPGSAWTTLISEKEANPSVPITAVVNPDNGPGATYSSTYDSWIVDLRDAGINVLGYVYTSYGARSLSSIEADIAAYKQMYSVNGIFLDQMSSQPGYQSLYSSATAYAHSLGLNTVVGNPGTSVPPSYYGTVDILLIYENAGIPAMSTMADSTNGGTRSEFAIVSYDVPSVTAAEVSLDAQYASNIYMTSGLYPAPYSALPSYLPTLVSDVSSFEASTAPVVVDTVEADGSALTGIWTTVSYNGNTVDEGFSPLTFLGSAGNQYIVTVSNYESQTFSSWQSGSTDPSYTVVATSSTTTLTATFSDSYSISINSVTSNGAALNGMRDLIYSGGNLVYEGFTPTTYDGTPGATYNVCVDNYASYTFSHWNGGATTSCETVTLSSNLQLTATYNT